MTPSNYNLALTADALPQNLALGAYKYIFIRAVTGALQVSFDGQNWSDCKQNDRFGQFNPAPSKIYFRAKNSAAATVNFYASLDTISAQDTATSGASVSPLGNLGIVNGTAGNVFDTVSNGNVAVNCSAAGYLSVANNVNLKISGTSAAGFRRQMIVFSIAPTALSGNGLNVLDANGGTLITIAAGSPPVALPFDGDLYVSGAGGAALVTIGQFFLKA